MKEELTAEELNAITRCIKTHYGYDFGEYAEASLKRRILRFSQLSKVPVADFVFHITNEKPFFFWMLQSLTVNVTEMFRDPGYYKALQAQVLPVLSTYPIIKIWIAGCSSGEEAFSMAILLNEAGLLERTKIYATDLNMANIETAIKGIIPVSHMKEYTSNYIKAGGKADFSDYYTARYDNAIIKRTIRKNILFSQHDLVNDYVFNEFQLICCRNVMIYFKQSLQNRVVHLFRQSLSPLGFLALGSKESLLFTDSQDAFEKVNKSEKIYRLKAL